MILVYLLAILLLVNICYAEFQVCACVHPYKFFLIMDFYYLKSRK
jgi:hypothetical protein